MKYCLYFKDGKKLFDDAFFTFYSKDDDVGITILKKIEESNKTLYPFISSKKECIEVKKTICGHDPYWGTSLVKWKIIPVFYGKLLSLYNSIFNFILNKKLNF